MTRVVVEYCGEEFEVAAGQEFSIGRDADLIIDDDNPFLHRRFLVLVPGDNMWWLANVGDRLSATLTDAESTMRAALAPGARMPLAFNETSVVFTAGPTTYEFSIAVEDLETPAVPMEDTDFTGSATIGAVALTESQRLLIIALAEPLLRRQGEELSALPSSAKAAKRLGWSLTKFNRKLDNVCDKFDRLGVRGLRGGPGNLASNRRARLVEYAIGTRIVTSADLELLHNLPRP
ncbi:MAG: hypothetical protein Q4G21_08000 [Dermabacter sp.]|nr:hypothetical protein [Dermabacter sp.]